MYKAEVVSLFDNVAPEHIAIKGNGSCQVLHSKNDMVDTLYGERKHIAWHNPWGSLLRLNYSSRAKVTSQVKYKAVVLQPIHTDRVQSFTVFLDTCPLKLRNRTVG